MAKYKITYLKDTFENTEETPVMDLSYWTDWMPSAKAEQEIRSQRPDLLETQIIEYPGEPQDDEWEAYQSEVLDIQGDLVNWYTA